MEVILHYYYVTIILNNFHLAVPSCQYYYEHCNCPQSKVYLCPEVPFFVDIQLTIGQKMLN